MAHFLVIAGWFQKRYGRLGAPASGKETGHPLRNFGGLFGGPARAHSPRDRLTVPRYADTEVRRRIPSSLPPIERYADQPFQALVFVTEVFGQEFPIFVFDRWDRVGAAPDLVEPHPNAFRSI